MTRPPSRMGEDALIARYFAPLAGEAGLGLKDDVACLSVPVGFDLVTTVDTVVAGVHFFTDDPPSAIGEKALGVNLSDIAAKGAVPAGFLLALALPDAWTEAWLEAFADGIGGMAKAFSCPLLGGDTTRAAGPLVISITAFGFVPKGRMVARTTAKPGDLVAVTGTIGDAAIGLKIRAAPESDWAAALAEPDYTHLIDRYLRPQPRLAFADVLRTYAGAAMDVSDGLVGDLAKMLRASGVTGSLAIEQVPLSAAAHAAIGLHPVLMADAVTGGDDYEILFTLAPENLAAMRLAAKAARVPAAVIGAVSAGRDPLTVTHRGETFLTRSGSFSHF